MDADTLNGAVSGIWVASPGAFVGGLWWCLVKGWLVTGATMDRETKRAEKWENAYLTERDSRGNLERAIAQLPLPPPPPPAH